mgnify:CR=1 FL=1
MSRTVFKPIQFSDIMNGLQYTVNCAQDTLQNHQIQNLTRLFEGTNANNANTFQSKKNHGWRQDY